MRKLITVGIVLGVLAAAGWWLVEGSVPISGERSHDFGPVEVPGVVQLKHTYVLTNRSRSSISIAAIRPGCGCTTVDFPKDATVLAFSIFNLVDFLTHVTFPCCLGF